MPKVSVIIPVYNVEKYLHECLDSIVNQTFCDIEIICVDDGSTDSSGSILDEYAAKDSRFIVIHQKNATQAVARNNGLKYVHGEYILFVDSDDALSLDTIEKTYTLALTSGSELIMFCLYSDKSKKKQILCPCDITRPVTDSFSKTKLVFYQGPGIWKWLWKTELIDRLSLRFYEGTQFEDTPFVVKGALNANSISVIPESLYFYRTNNGSSTRKLNDYYCKYSWFIYNLIMEDMKDMNLSEECLHVIYRNKLDLTWNGYCNFTPQNLKSQFRNNLKENVFPHEYEWVKSNILFLTPRQRLFFVRVYGGRIAYFTVLLKIVKESLADWIAKRLLPYSPWLQNICSSIDSQKTEIEQLTNIQYEKIISNIVSDCKLNKQ